MMGKVAYIKLKLFHTCIQYHNTIYDKFNTLILFYGVFRAIDLYKMHLTPKTSFENKIFRGAGYNKDITLRSYMHNK